MYEHRAYLIETLTNTHVGSGDATYGVADKVIQKDPVTSAPVIHPSSLKGAIKDHFEPFVCENAQPANSGKMKKFTFQAVFGGEEQETRKPEGTDEKAQEKTDPNEKDKALLKKAPQHGLIKFHEARLLTLPVRASRRVYYNASSCFAVLDYLKALRDFKVSIPGGETDGIEKLVNFFKTVSEKLNADHSMDFIVFDDKQDAPLIEEYEKGRCIPRSGDGAMGLWEKAGYDDIRNLAGKYLSPPAGSDNFLDSLALFPNDDFVRICDESLPVVARNSLDEKGISRNLFYEEVLPRRSVLWFITGTFHLFYKKDENAFSKAFEFFEKKMLTDNIQMGANASIGYGVTRISRVGEVAS